MVFDLQVKVRGDREVIRALEGLPRDAQREMREGAVRLSRQLANFVRAAGRADTRQSARASRTVRARTDGFTPSVVAGPHPMLKGSEFGILRRTGWYAHPRYLGYPARQYRPHRGSASYWFFKAAKQARPIINAELEEISTRVLAGWPR